MMVEKEQMWGFPQPLLLLCSDNRFGCRDIKLWRVNAERDDDAQIRGDEIRENVGVGTDPLDARTETKSDKWREVIALVVLASLALAPVPVPIIIIGLSIQPPPFYSVHIMMVALPSCFYLRRSFWLCGRGWRPMEGTIQAHQSLRYLLPPFLGEDRRVINMRGEIILLWSLCHSGVFIS